MKPNHGDHWEHGKNSVGRRVEPFFHQSFSLFFPVLTEWRTAYLHKRQLFNFRLSKRLTIGYEAIFGA
jgi:hypothetical protein